MMMMMMMVIIIIIIIINIIIFNCFKNCLFSQCSIINDSHDATLLYTECLETFSDFFVFLKCSFVSFWLHDYKISIFD